MKSHRTFWTVFVLLVLAAPARAETWVGDSLEWMTDDSQLVLRGKVIKSTEVNAPGASGFHDMTIHVYEVLKGTYKDMKITIRSWKGEVNGEGEYLFFLKKGNDVYGPKDYRRPIVDNAWTQRIFWNGNPYGSINLKQPGHGQGIPTSDLKVLKKEKEIVKVVRDRVEFTKKNPPVIKPAEKDAKTGVMMPRLGVIEMDAPSESEVFRTFWGGSAVVLYVPADKSLYPKIMKKVEKNREWYLIPALVNYPGPKTEKLLRDLLNDNTKTETFQNGKVIRINYPVREAAYSALVRLGIQVPMPVLSKEP